MSTGWPYRAKLGGLTLYSLASVLLLLVGTAAYAQTAVCWPVTSDLGTPKHYCTISAPAGSAVTGTQLMTALAEIEPLPEAIVLRRISDRNRGGIRRRFERFETFALPIIAGFAAGDVIQVSNGLRVALALLPVTVPQVRSWVGAAAPPEAVPPANLVGHGDIALDSHGEGQAYVYSRKEGGVRRVQIVTPAETNPAPLGPAAARPLLQFQPASWYTLYREHRVRTGNLQWQRQYDLAWREADREMGPDPSAVFLAEAK